ncbi:flavin reductase family protein [Mangrovihabitans endophyticus]|uniref:Flavin reductase like domain-containing protein n=1 Tax=Mangrovihabitans endophyticus TaxID=1751298 RepID=A0A8J3BXB6_9ACTN|nr:flavin reductase family protein [Mangrovihabitans endophyticus]GGK78280.1 hypothetical protein GCM10012284_10240 [Mangrovihabitans endophyticus]
MNGLLQAALDQHYATLLADGGAPGGGPGGVGEDDFRTAMGHLPTGVSIVTTRHADGVWGMTVGSLTSLSLRPPLLLVCLHQGSTTLDLLTTEGRFAISVLAAGQQRIADVYARPRDRHADVELAVADGLPVIAGATVWFTCEHRQTHVSGDHAIVVGAVRHARHHGGEPLVRHRSRYCTLR